MSTQLTPPFRAIDSSATWTKGLLYVSLVVSVVSIISTLLELELIARAFTGNVSEEEALASDFRQLVIAVFRVLTIVGSTIAYFVWLYGAHKNLPSLGGRVLKYTPTWAILWYFVPFFCLIRPIQVMCEIWRGSEPTGLPRDLADDGTAVRDKLPTPSFIGWWWGVTLVAYFLSNSAFKQSMIPDLTLAQLQLSAALNLVCDLLEIPHTVLVLLLVGRVTSWQSQRAGLIAQLAEKSSQ